MNFRVIRSYLAKLYTAQNATPQEQLSIVTDISRRGFLKDIVKIVAFGAIAKTCCAVPDEYKIKLPDIGDSDRSNLSPEEADFLGNQVVHNITNQGSMLKDYDVLDYLNDIGGNLASYSALAGQNFNFYLVRDKIINAFALPGGYICLYNGLIYTTTTEAELTSVMSHEIGHVVQHHIFRNISGYKRNQWVSLAGILSGALLATVNPGAGALAIQGSQGLSTQNMLSNSRDFEREADRVGQKIMYNAGFDPHAMPEFFKRLKATTKFNDDEAFEFLRTHPVTSERISEAMERANHLQTKMRPDSTSFLLAREKCRVRQLGIAEANKFYLSALKTKKYAYIETEFYGLAFSHAIEIKYQEALAYINKIEESQFKTHPAVISLKAFILTALGNYKEADKIYEDGLINYPKYKALWLGQVDLFIKQQNLASAQSKLLSLEQEYEMDADVWIKEALISSEVYLNNPQRYHYALGNKEYILGNYSQANVQYQIALKQKSDVKLNDVIRSHMLGASEMMKMAHQYGG